ncbi:restriction endonuclease subunit S [Pseudoalteromonas sp. T1lg10]|uniref:restriction endonuclease subunit S n=1 Tax=Pseudoalteromonas sp. T1lg10 TaxID=2077093 RepID=UPI000CF6B5A3|nr:restriction endonuclease subunit S [Pseudoalteromonas sp. T1lg10]
MSQLPIGWTKSTLGEFVKLKNGFAFKSKDYVEAGENTVPVVRISDIQNGKASTEAASHIDSSKINSKFLVTKGDLLIAMSGATTGKTGVFNSDVEAYQNQRVGNLKLVDEENSCPRFRNYLIKSLQKEILKKAYGAAQPNISAKDLAEIEVNLAPFIDQKRIADKLDSVLAKVEAAQARLDKIPTILKRFRQSVLAAATSGELTKDWHDENQVPDWATIKVSDIVEKIEAGKNIKCQERPPEANEFGIIKISAVTWGVYNEDESKTLNDNSLFLENRRVQVGDFLISRANTLELLGMPVIVHETNRNLMLSDKVLRLVMNDSDKEWLNIFLRSPSGRKEIESRATGNQQSMRNIGQKALLDIDLLFPSEQEKFEIVRVANELFEHANVVEKQYSAAKARLDKLTQSILAKAFRGELVLSKLDKEVDEALQAAETVAV